jgi:hypothetical protein
VAEVGDQPSKACVLGCRLAGVQDEEQEVRVSREGWELVLRAGASVLSGRGTLIRKIRCPRKPRGNGGLQDSVPPPPRMVTLPLIVLACRRTPSARMAVT